MKKILIIGLIGLMGCVRIQIPNYLQDTYPYKRQYSIDYEQTLEATKKALEELGWVISKISDPVIYEQNWSQGTSQRKQILLFTESKQTSMFLFSRYTQLNTYVRDLEKGAEVELRYIAITPMPFKEWRSYRNDRLVNKIFDRIDRLSKE